MDARKKLPVFLGFFTLAFAYYRWRVWFTDGKVPFIRELTGLTVHHLHIGLLIILIAALLLIFYKSNWVSVSLMGFGLGTVMDSFVSRMFSFNSVRVQEIAIYNYSFWWTVLLFVNIVLLSFIVYFWRERY